MNLFRRILFALCFAFAGGCASTSAPQPATRTTSVGAAPPIINWSNFSDKGLIQWQLVAGKKLGRLPIVFACHSGPNDKGDWYAFPSIDLPDVPVATVAKILHSVFPDTPIILLACNAGHARLDIPNVYYPDNKVWTYPGPDWRAEWDDWCIGHFDEFLQGKPHAIPQTQPGH